MDKGVTNMNIINMDAFPVEVSPKIKQGAAAEEIAFSIGESALGVVLVARSADGVCAILIGSEAAELESDLARRFIDSKLVRNDRKLSNDLQKILRFIEAPSEGSTCRSTFAERRSNCASGRSCSGFHPGPS